MRRSHTRPTTDLVLVGGGHAHVQVLKRFAMDPPPGARLTVVVDQPIAVYSGMVPGFVAGQYRAEELEIDVVPLARLAGARVVLAAAVGIDPDARRLRLEERAPLPYDVISFDIGSTVAGLDTPGVREHALPTRPIGRFVRRVEDRLAALRSAAVDAPRAAVVGAGAGGVELAFTLRERLRHLSGDASVVLLEADDRILPGYPRGVADRILGEARSRDIEVVTGRAVTSVDATGIVAGDERWPADLVVWVAGAAPQRRFDSEGLVTDEAGFLRTRPTLQVEGRDEVFAVGDCATLGAHPDLAKAGVYAVRQGPILADNLRRSLRGGALRRYRPQRDFLTLLNLGDGSAAGCKWGLSFAGAWVFRWKDWIDRRFVRRFQTLDEADAVADGFAELVEMRARMEVRCGGCAAKLGQGALERALARVGADDVRRDARPALPPGDDAAAYATPGGDRVVSSVDQFRAFTDDPWLVGRVGAVNAVSDVFAKGIRPEVAQAIVALPEASSEDEREELLYQVLAGARRALDEMEVSLVGGHTTTASELLVGFQVEGFARADLPLLALDRLEPDRTLILTKPLGTGVLFHADMTGRARGPWIEAALASMLRPNAEASRIARETGATAATDVTGFGLARHLASMLRASGVGAALDLEALPALPGTRSLLAAGLRSTFHAENASAERGIAGGEGVRSHPAWPLLFDPQTSGGLLFGVPKERTSEALAALRRSGDTGAAAVGVTEASEDGRLRVTLG